jgi:hypothetical protein
MTSINLADHAKDGTLTVEEVNTATKEKLETDKSINGYTVLYFACTQCGIEVVEAIINKGVNLNQVSGFVSIVIIIIFYLFGLN